MKYLLKELFSWIPKVLAHTFADDNTLSSFAPTFEEVIPTLQST